MVHCSLFTAYSSILDFIKAIKYAPSAVLLFKPTAINKILGFTESLLDLGRRTSSALATAMTEKVHFVSVNAVGA